MKILKDNKGFTLVELLGVVVVLVAILLIAIPSVSSTVERNKQKEDNKKYEIVLSAAEIYVSIKGSSIYSGNDCVIAISSLLNEDYLQQDEVILSSGTSLENSYVKFISSSKKFEVISNKGSLNNCY